MNGGVAPMLKHYFRDVWGNRSLNFYVLCAGEWLYLLYFEKRTPSTHWISNRTTSDLMAVWVV